jgi:D-alanyl-D-alanine carboxypeptidase/D-alanyl-D-alanine-endopeptidase (penicillin-binding protein 4)
MFLNSKVLSVLILLSSFHVIGFASNLFAEYPEIEHAGILIEKAGKAAIANHAQDSFIPASTTKLVTAWLALNHWGEDHQFKTDFYLDVNSKILWIKGSGDPFLTSEEILLIAKQLKNLGLTSINAIGLDSAFFKAGLTPISNDYSNNPYDAIPSAIAANFNTIAVKRVNKTLVSAESQTPLTQTALKIASQHRINSTKTRINTGKKSSDAEQYFAELLAVFLRQQGIQVDTKIVWGSTAQLAVFYSHLNSKSLGEMIRPMLKYSTNFIANQLVLSLSAEYFQQPANFADVQRYMEISVSNQFHWKNITLKDGAGLSRDNRLSPRQLVELLNSFRTWKHLLPEVSEGIYAKSGTLNKVSTLAGYRVDMEQNWHAFALMMNQTVYHKRRNAIAKALTSP